MQYVQQKSRIDPVSTLFGWRPHKGQMNKKNHEILAAVSISRSTILAAVKNGVKNYKPRLIMARVQ